VGKNPLALADAAEKRSSILFRRVSQSIFSDMLLESRTIGAIISALSRKVLKLVVGRTDGLVIHGTVERRKRTILSLQKFAKELIKLIHSKK
jgi:hypothetical protein